jgi:hypothetical protein
MNEIRTDPKEGDNPRNVRLNIPINEITRDPKRDFCGPSQTGGYCKVPSWLTELNEASQMGLKGKIRPAMNVIAGMTKGRSAATKIFATSVANHSQGLKLEELFPNVKTCPSNFLPNKARE